MQSNKRRKRKAAPTRQKPSFNVQQELEEKRRLDENIKQIQAYTDAIRKHIWQQKDFKAQKRAAKSEGLDETKLETPMEEEELEKFTDNLLEEGSEQQQSWTSRLGKGLFEQQLSLPEPILNRIGDTNAITLLTSETPNWGNVIKALYNNSEQLKDLPVSDVDKLIVKIPLSQRAELMPIVHEMMFESGVQPSKLTLDLTMAAYADRGVPTVVEAFMDELRERKFQPDDYSYGHLIKAYSKIGDLKKCVKVLKQMQSEGVVEHPSTNVTTNLLQTCIKVGDYKQAEEIFSMMKYLSSQTQPDVRVYNSMMLSSSKQHNVDRVLDLYNEMQTQSIEPDVETLLTLIYACARDERTHLKAWQYVLELQERKFPITRKLINTLMYLCGNTGELTFARALFRQLCLNESSYPDSYTINCLFKAYVNYKPGFFSPVLTTALGNQIRSTFLVNQASFDKEGYDSYLMPPFLSFPMLRNKEQVIWESRAIFMFLKDNHPKLLNSKVILNYLAVPAKLGGFNEFRARYTEQTYLEATSNTTDVYLSRPDVVPRNHYIYDLAIKACQQPGQNTRDALNFASEVWTDRGKWRKTEGYTKLSKENRSHSDFLFAREMVTTLAQCEEVGDAIDLLKSSIKQFDWKHHHIQPLINKLIELDDINSLSTVKKLIKQKWSDRSEVEREYISFEGEKNHRRMMNKQTR